jgi:pyrroloquinoline quinone (PQQ) biosynthesis protein C
MSTQNAFVNEVKEKIRPELMRLFSSRIYCALLNEEKAPLDLWKVYLWESYHYVKHNGVNQALAVLRTETTRKKLMIKYLKHALEEIDHDSMCLRDLEKCGVPRDLVIASRPLAEVASFASFLYDFVMRENPIGRLGYSLWAEGINEYSGTIISRLRHHYGFPDEFMTFVVAHADLDVGHAEECEETIAEFAHSSEDREAILFFGPATARVFYYALEAMYERWEREKGTFPGCATAEEAIAKYGRAAKQTAGA